MRTAAFIVLLALAATVYADIDTCNVGTYLVDDYSVYNLAPYQKNNKADGIFVAKSSDPNQDDDLVFSICHDLVTACDGKTSTFGIKSDDGKCQENVAMDAAFEVNSTDSSNPAKGIKLVYPNTTYNKLNYQLVVEITCNDAASSDDKLPPFTYKQAFVDGVNVITASTSSYYGCSFANLGELVKFMQKYKTIFAIIFIVVGIFLAFFGLKLFKVAIFVMAAVGGFFLSAVLFYQFASYGSAAWVVWLLFFVCLIIGLVLGYITVKFEKVGFFGVGLVLGVMGWFLLYGSILNSFLHLTKVITYVVAGACGIIGGGLAIWIYKDILIIATAFCGSFLSVASVFSYIPKAPAISDVLNGSTQWSALLIAQLAAIGILTIAGIYVQFKNKKDEEDTEQEGNADNVYDNMKNY